MIQLNWHLFNISNNYIISKHLDDCIILHDDKKYFMFNIKHYEDFKFISTTNQKISKINYVNEFVNSVKDTLNEYITYDEEIIILPIYNNELLENNMDIKNIVNIGIFILKKIKFNKKLNSNNLLFMPIVKYGIEPINYNIDELRQEHYKELKSDIDDIIYIKQNGFYFNLINSIYKTENIETKFKKEQFINLYMNTINDNHKINIINVLDIIRDFWPNWQIIWRGNKQNITKYLKYKPWEISVQELTCNIELIKTNKKYANIIHNQSLLNCNNVINSLDLLINKIIDDTNNLKINDDENKKKISKITNNNKFKYDRAKILKNYNNFSGSKHLHYICKDKIKNLEIKKLLEDLYIT